MAMPELCITCPMVKAAHQPHVRKPESRAKEPLGRVVSDKCGPFRHKTIGGCKSVRTFVDDHSNYRFSVTELDSKKETFSTSWLDYRRHVAFRLNVRVKDLVILKFRSDNAKEYTAKATLKEFDVERIFTELSAPYVHEQNPLAEVTNLHVTQAVSCQLIEMNVPKCFWGEFWCSTEYVTNRLNGPNGEPSPHEILFGTEPINDHIRVLGCIALIHIDPKFVDKLDRRNTVGMLCGYNRKSNNYRIWVPSDLEKCDPRSGKLYDNISHAVFLERTPFWNLSDQNPSSIR